jgi:tetratricopeptide (TPR) repeat protein/KaiC/GvpD/RAD55 family RecA-like ATPase
MAAAKDELARFSNQQAIQHFTYALQNIPDGHAEEKRMALEGLGDAYAANNMYAEAIKTFDELAASTTGLVRLCALRKASDAAFHRGDKPDLLIEYAKKAEELAVYNRLEMARIINNRGRSGGWAGRGDTRSDLADYDAALGVFEEENSLPDVAEALWRSGIASSVIEDLKKKGLGELLRSVAIFRELGDVRKEAEVTLYLGCGFRVNGLYSEARREFVKVPTVGEKLGVFFELSSASIFLSELDEREGKLANALSLSLKALEYCRKTDAVALVPSYATLARLYSKLGDLQRAEECFETIAKQPPEVVLQGQEFITRSKAVFLAAQGLGDEANQIFENFIELLRSMGFTAAMAIEIYENYAWALEKQGRLEKAKVQQEKAQKMLKQVDEMFERAEVQLSVMLPRKVQVGEEFEMRLDLVNVARTAAALTKIDGVFLPEFNVATLPSYCSLQNGSIEIKEKTVAPFQVETIKLKLKVEKTGSYGLNPEVNFLDNDGKTKTSRTSPITVTAQPVKPAYETLPGRITTGTVELDRLLLGGIPEKYAVALAAPSCNERETLINRFLKAGVEADETTFYVTVELGNAKALAETHQSNFYVFLCNPRADAMIESLPNVVKLKGVENLTEIDIALTKAFRTLNPSAAMPRRICLEIVSDALLQHHAVITRKWLSALLPDLKSKGFITLALMDPRMHPDEEAQAILGLFDGEIRIAERESAKGTEKVLKILKLYNQQYSENELVLTKEKLLQL